ncbi:MAG: hypothetical protein SGCHY_005017 [Lobulomycetales sp.]
MGAVRRSPRTAKSLPARSLRSSSNAPKNSPSNALKSSKPGRVIKPSRVSKAAGASKRAAAKSKFQSYMRAPTAAIVSINKKYRVTAKTEQVFVVGEKMLQEFAPDLVTGGSPSRTAGPSSSTVSNPADSDSDLGNGESQVQPLHDELDHSGCPAIDLSHPAIDRPNPALKEQEECESGNPATDGQGDPGHPALEQASSQFPVISHSVEEENPFRVPVIVQSPAHDPLIAENSILQTDAPSFDQL